MSQQSNNIVIDYDLVQTNELENLLQALNTHINALQYNYGVKYGNNSCNK